jgi:hypothetical protein
MDDAFAVDNDVVAEVVSQADSSSVDQGDEDGSNDECGTESGCPRIKGIDLAFSEIVLGRLRGQEDVRGLLPLCACCCCSGEVTRDVGEREREGEGGYTRDLGPTNGGVRARP